MMRELIAAMTVVGLATGQPSAAVKQDRLSPVSDLLEIQDTPIETPIDTRCRVAVEIVRDVILPSINAEDGRPLIFSPEPAEFKIMPFGSDERLFGGFSAGSPSARLVRSFSAHSTDSAVSLCSQVRDLLATNHIRFDRNSALRGAEFKHGARTRAIIVFLSLPVISEDGQRALYLHSVFCGGRCANGDLVQSSRNEAGTWRSGWRYPLWMS